MHYKSDDSNKLLIIKENKGSSSVLVILIMITLVVLGLLALMTTYSSFKLSKKNANWTSEYYKLDSKAEAALAEMDGYLYESEVDTQAYISSKDYEKPISTLVDANIQKVIHAGWEKAVANGNESIFIEHLYRKLYYMHSYKRLKSATNKVFEVNSQLDFAKAEAVFASEVAVPDRGVLAVTTIVYEGTGEETRSLAIGIDVKYNTTDYKGNSRRYIITAWKELPKNFEYEDSIEFGNLEVE